MTQTRSPASPLPLRERVARSAGRGGIAPSRVRALRSGMTEAEKALWYRRRAGRLTQYKFRRQHPVGRYIVDFVCLSHRLIVEVDGRQHLDSAHDAERDAWLCSQDFRVLRVWNQDVLHRSDQVLELILHTLESPPLP